MNSTSKIVAALLLALIGTGLAFAQGSASGDLHVTVKDQKGAMVTNAVVTAREQAKAFERSTTLNTDGEYRLVSLPPGVYTVTIEAPGFSKTEAKDQAVTVGQMKDLPVTLNISGAATVVTVSSEADLVETTRSSTTDTIDQRRIDNLPINGRNYINFTLTDSQVVRDNAPNTGAAPTSGLNIERPARPLEPGQRRWCRRHRQFHQRRALDGLAGSGAGIPDHHQQLRRRVRTRFRRRGQHHHPLRIERVSRRCLRLSAQS